MYIHMYYIIHMYYNRFSGISNKAAILLFITLLIALYYFVFFHCISSYTILFLLSFEKLIKNKSVKNLRFFFFNYTQQHIPGVFSKVIKLINPVNTVMRFLHHKQSNKYIHIPIWKLFGFKNILCIFSYSENQNINNFKFCNNSQTSDMSDVISMQGKCILHT